jgi:hypothetical protein
MSHTTIQPVLHCTTPSAVSLKTLLCILFLFFNRAGRVLRGGSMLSTTMHLGATAMLPIVASAALHIACLCPGIVVRTRYGRAPVFRAILHVLLLHALVAYVTIFTLARYATTASFLSILLASHLCFAVRPMNTDLVPAQALLYGGLMNGAAYALPLIAWVVLPILRVDAVEFVFLLYVPEVICFLFAYLLQFTTTVLHIVAVVAVEPSWRSVRG